MNQAEWDKTNGVVCPTCEQKSLRMIDGICIQCHRNKVAEKEERLGRKRERRYFIEKLRRGTISLAQIKEGRL